jgi:hypothetical protein
VPVRVSACRIYAEKSVSTHYMSRRELLSPPSLSLSSAASPSPAPYASRATAISSLTRRRAVSAFAPAILRKAIFSVQRESIVRASMAETSGGRHTRRVRGPTQGRRRSRMWMSKRWLEGE